MLEKKKKPARLVIYASGPDPESLDAQVQRIREHARDILGFTLDPAIIWEEIVPGTGTDRPKREGMIHAAWNRDFSDLCLYSPCRLSRNTGEFIDICDKLDLRGVNIHFVEGHPSGSLYSRVHMITQYKDRISQRIRSGLERAAREGRIPSGSAPYEYSYDPKTKTHTINPAEAPAVQKMFEMAAEGMTPGEIARLMNSQGVLTRRDRKWTRTGVTRILKNPRSAGMAQFMGIRIETVPIIGKALFHLVQAMLGQRKTRPTPRLSGTFRRGTCHDRRAYPYLLTGMLWCGPCGERMAGTGMKSARTK